MDNEKEAAVIALREAIQKCEEFGMVWAEGADGERGATFVVTGASIDADGEIVIS